MRCLLHVCCAVCLPGALKSLRSKGLEIACLFYNPNIHPLLEFRKRLKALRVFQERENMELHCVEEYGLQEYLAAVHGREADRCRWCYELRLGKSASTARELGFDTFSTTLLASQQQDHALVRETAESASKRVGIPFYYMDLRASAEEGIEVAKKYGLYRQSYCGCIYSEWERFRDTTRELYRGPGGPSPARGEAGKDQKLFRKSQMPPRRN